MDILEKKFQTKLIHEIKRMFPGCIVMKQDPNYFQGFPDLLILYGEHWAALECKRCATAHHQPNQDYMVKKLNAMAYASFVYPENKETVLNELQQTFGDRRQTCALLGESTNVAQLRQDKTEGAIQHSQGSRERHVTSLYRRAKHRQRDTIGKTEADILYVCK